MKLIICVDGLGKDLLNKNDTPFLYEFGRKNSLSRLKTLFCWTGLEYSFFIGKPPSEHGIWFEFVKSNNSIFNNFLLKLPVSYKLRNYIGALIQLNKRDWISGTHNIPNNKLKYFDVPVKGGLWRLNYFKEKSLALYKWPFFITKKNSIHKQMIYTYENDDKRLTRLLSSKDKDVYYVQLMGVDKAIHKHGKKSIETKKAVKKMDDILKKHISRFLEKNKDAEVFLWSDHGFADIKNYIDIEIFLPRRNDFLYFIAGTTVHFWFKTQEAKKAVSESLKKFREVYVLTDKLADKYKIPREKRYGDLIVFVKKGNYFFPNFYQKKRNEKFIAMHGYPDDNELDGFMISNKNLPETLKIYDVRKYLDKK